MKRRVPCTFPLSSCLAVVAAVVLNMLGFGSAEVYSTANVRL